MGRIHAILSDGTVVTDVEVQIKLVNNIFDWYIVVCTGKSTW